MTNNLSKSKIKDLLANKIDEYKNANSINYNQENSFDTNATNNNENKSKRKIKDKIH